MGFLRPRMVAPSPLSDHGIPCRCYSRLRRLPRGKDVLFRALGISVCGQYYLFFFHAERYTIGVLEKNEKLKGYQIRQCMAYEVEMKTIQNALFFGLSGYII